MPAEFGAEFDLGRVEEGIAGTRFRGQLTHLASTGSTNELALEAARAGGRCGVWSADEQTAGRGRGGHTWHSAAGDGLYVSALVAPRLPLSQATLIPLAAALAARTAVLDATGLSADIRWPNDLMFGERKFGGILVESVAENAGGEVGREAMLRYAVVGIGINVNHAVFPEELKALATSLAIESGRRFAREPLLAALLLALEDELARLEGTYSGADGGQDLASRLARASTWVEGKRVRVGEDGGYTGVTRGLDALGFLRVQDEAGVIHTVRSGGVRSA